MHGEYAQLFVKNLEQVAGFLLVNLARGFVFPNEELDEDLGEHASCCSDVVGDLCFDGSVVPDEEWGYAEKPRSNGRLKSEFCVKSGMLERLVSA